MPTIEELEAQVFKLQHRCAGLTECIRIGEGLARADGYSRGYAAGRSFGRRMSARRERSSQPWVKSFPMLVSSGGRNYQAMDERALEALLQFLFDGNLQAANRYRVAGGKFSRWPKAKVQR